MDDLYLYSLQYFPSSAVKHCHCVIFASRQNVLLIRGQAQYSVTMETKTLDQWLCSCMGDEIIKADIIGVTLSMAVACVKSLGPLRGWVVRMQSLCQFGEGGCCACAKSQSFWGACEDWCKRTHAHEQWLSLNTTKGWHLICCAWPLTTYSS